MSMLEIPQEEGLKAAQAAAQERAHLELVPPLDYDVNYGNETNYMQNVTIPVQIGRICVVSQTREGRSAIQDDLEASIARTGLKNSLDVARLNRTALEEYLDFVRVTWGDNTDIDNLPETQEGSGEYFLLMAGHTRLTTIWSIERAKEREAHRQGLPYNAARARVPADVYTGITSPEDVLTHQIDENIHQRVSQEREAIALVEAYQFGIMKGRWATPAEFIRANNDRNRFSDRQLSDAIAFSQLPADVRAFVFSGTIKYGAGVALGNYTKVLPSYYAHKYFDGRTPDELNDEEAARLGEMLHTSIWAEASNLAELGLNITAAQMRYKHMRESLIAEVQETGETASAPKAPVVEQLDFSFFEEAAADEAQKLIREKRNTTRHAVERMLTGEHLDMLAIQEIIGRATGIRDQQLTEQLARSADRIAQKARSSAQ